MHVCGYVAQLIYIYYGRARCTRSVEDLARRSLFSRARRRRSVSPEVVDDECRPRAKNGRDRRARVGKGWLVTRPRSGRLYTCLGQRSLILCVFGVSPRRKEYFFKSWRPATMLNVVILLGELNLTMSRGTARTFLTTFSYRTCNFEINIRNCFRHDEQSCFLAEVRQVLFLFFFFFFFFDKSWRVLAF